MFLLLHLLLVIDALIGITSTSLSLVFRISNGIVKKLLKSMRKKIKKQIKLLLARRKLNSIENVISKALTDNKFNQEEFRTIINEKSKYYI